MSSVSSGCDERQQTFQPVSFSDEDDDGDGEAREILLVPDILIGRDENINRSRSVREQLIIV